MEKSPKVALLLDHSNSYERDIIRGIARFSKQNAQWIYYPISTLSLRTQSFSANLKRILQWQPDGIITNYTNDTLKQLENISDIPIIFANYPTMQPPTPMRAYIQINFAALAISGARYLTGLGFKHYAYCGYNNDKSAIFNKNFADQIAQNAFITHRYKQPKSPVNQYWDKEQHFLEKWIKSLPKPIAILACDDLRAQHLAVVAKQLNLVIPFEITILGCSNDSLLCETTTPTISSIAMNINKAGYSAAEQLASMMRDGITTVKNITIEPTHVVTRMSTEYLAIDDVDVVTAMRYIRYNTHQHLQVDEIVAQTNVSRGVLESKFKQFIHRTINQEVRRVRVEQIAQLLVETDQSITEIAYATGFKNVEHIARYFRKEKEMSPRDYRKKFTKE